MRLATNKEGKLRKFVSQQEVAQALGLNTKTIRSMIDRRELDSAFGVGNEEKPRPADVSICARCCNFLIYDETLNLRKPLECETRLLGSDPLVQLARRAALEAAMERNREN